MAFTRCSRSSKYRGSGLISSLGSAAGSVLNRAIDLLPIELNLPTYQYCGPGTNLSKRLARGDPGINGLDAACKQHDIAYAKYKDNKNRAEADSILANRAWERFKAGDSSLGEKAAAWAVTNIMKAKKALGGGVRNEVRKKKISKRKVGSAKNKNQKKQNKKKRKTQTTDGRGLYLRPYQGSGKNKKKCRRHK